MKASTLFALTIALVLGLGAAAGAKYFGIFNKTTAAETPQPKPEPPPMILVAGTNLFKGIALTEKDVRLRAARPEEIDDLRINKGKYLPAVTSAINLRVPKENITADTPIRLDHLEPQDYDNLEKRLEPYMRAVNVQVAKWRSGGGALQLGDRVDVWLLTEVHTSDGGAKTLRSACLARDCKIIMKRDLLFTVLKTDPDDEPISFTLQANPYRAALIHYAQEKGLITLEPRPKPRAAMLPIAPTASRPNFSIDDSKEYRDENQRVEAIDNGELSVSDIDLVRVFGLPELVRPTVTPPVRVTTIRGVNYSGETVFGPSGRVTIQKPEAETGGAAEYTRGGSAADDKAEPLHYIFSKPVDSSSPKSATPRPTGSGAPPPVVVDIDAKKNKRPAR
jgi:Flp pilus assembly protein CpaB